MTPEHKISKEIDLFSPSWNEIAVLLPDSLNPGEDRLLRGYYDVQKKITLKQKESAKKKMNSLLKMTGYEEFEAKNDNLFAAIDIAVRGSTNRLNGDKKPIEPLFRLKKS